MGFQTIRTMSGLSGSFMYRRVMDELMPKVTRFLETQATVSSRSGMGMVYERSSIAKLQTVLLSQLAALYREIEATKEECNIVAALCKRYIGDRNQPTFLKDAAQTSLDRLNCEISLNE